jgi:hypothetical protein
MTLNEKIFLKHIRKKCKEYNVKLVLKNTKKIKLSDNIYVGGYFWDEPDKYELACALKNPEYLNLLVHEYSHMEQWVENSSIWKDAKYVTHVDEWLEGRDIRDIDQKIDRVKMFELDCEKRALENIKKFNLPINTKMYIKKANSYILFYNYLKESRKWSKPGKAPYAPKNNELWSLCPTRFMSDSYYETIPKKIYKKFVELDI